MFVLCCDVPPMDSARGAPRTGCHRAPLEVDCCYANFLNLLNSHVCRVFQSPGKPAEKQKTATLGGFFSSPCRGDRVFVQCVRLSSDATQLEADLSRIVSFCLCWCLDYFFLSGDSPSVHPTRVISISFRLSVVNGFDLFPTVRC